jgi:hypothetical protein
MSLPDNWLAGQSFTAAAENAVELAANTSTNLLNGTNTGAILNNPVINGYTEGESALGIVGSNVTLTIATATLITATLTASALTTFAMPAVTAGKSTSFTMILKQAATTGNGTAVFTGVHWNSLGTPTITPTAGRADILSFVSDGVEWYGSYTQGYIP